MQQSALLSLRATGRFSLFSRETNINACKPPVARVVIAEVYNKSYTEYVKITNKGDGSADMSGWFVRGSKGDRTYTFPNGYVLPAGVAMRLHSRDGGTNNPPLDICWTDKTVWNNGGETVYLKDAQGNLVDQYSW